MEDERKDKDELEEEEDEDSDDFEEEESPSNEEKKKEYEITDEDKSIESHKTDESPKIDEEEGNDSKETIESKEDEDILGSEEIDEEPEVKESKTHEDRDHTPYEPTVESRETSESEFQEDSDDTIKISKSEIKKYAVFVIIAVIVIVGFYFFRGGTFGGVTGNVVNEQQPTQLPSEIAKVEVSVDDDAFKGDENAPVTIIEFSDYECPFCARFYTQTLAQIQSEYIDTGKVKFVYRDFPLDSIHPQARKSAEAAECAGEQGGNEVYFKMHDLLFENGVKGGVDSYKQFAGEIGLDQGKFDDCLDSGEMAAEVNKDLQDGQSYGVTGTPAFFVNGKLISGAQPFSAFQQAIEAELA